MARTRPDTPADLFSGPELEAGCGLPKRAVEVLKRESLMPAPARDAGRGGQALWSYEGMAEIAVVGAVFGGVPSLTLAARLGSAIYTECVATRGRVPSGLDRFRQAVKVLQPEDWKADGGLDDVKAHARLRRHEEIYKVGKSRSDDLRFFIVDRHYVFSGSTGNIPIMSPFGGRALPVAPEFIVHGWQRGGTADSLTVEQFEAALPERWATETEDEARAHALEETAKAAWEDAVSTVAINVSLAIRRALDTIYDLRFSKHGGASSP